MTFPILILDAHREVLFADAGADALIAEGWLARVRDGRFELVRPSEDLALKQQIAAMLRPEAWPVAGAQDAPPGCVVCRGAARDPAPRVLRLVPVACAGRRAVVVSIFSCSAGAAPDVRLLVRLFGLTGAEARVAACVAAGVEPSRIAQQFGVGIATIRTHIARSFSKLGVRRQADLAQLLANPGLRAPAAGRTAAAGPGLTPPR